MIAQLGERQTEDLKVLGSIPSYGSLFGYKLSLGYVSSLEKNLYNQPVIAQLVEHLTVGLQTSDSRWFDSASPEAIRPPFHVKPIKGHCSA